MNPRDSFRSALLKKAETKKKPLTDKMMKAMIPLFVEGRKYKTHKCGSCIMRIPGAPATCTVYENPISMTKGTCVLWKRGPAASHSQVHPQRMTAAQVGYVEYDGNVACSDCKHFSDDATDNEGRKYCGAWDGLAFPEECCITWDNPLAKTPEY